MIISNDAKYVQLWDLLTHLPVGPVEYQHIKCEEQRIRGHKVKYNLNGAARWYGQEFDLKITDEGWEIRVFSCMGGEDLCSEIDLVKLVIPKDKSKAIRVITKEGLEQGERVAKL